MSRVIEIPSDSRDQTDPTPAQVRAQISYLDSPNDYRDYLPMRRQHSSNVRERNSNRNGDERSDFSGFFLMLIFIVMGVLMLMRFLEDAG